MDVIVDNYFVALENAGEKLEDVEDVTKEGVNFIKS